MVNVGCLFVTDSILRIQTYVLPVAGVLRLMSVYAIQRVLEMNANTIFAMAFLQMITQRAHLMETALDTILVPVWMDCGLEMNVKLQFVTTFEEITQAYVLPMEPV